MNCCCCCFLLRQGGPPGDEEEDEERGELFFFFFFFVGDVVEVEGRVSEKRRNWTLRGNKKMQSVIRVENDTFQTHHAHGTTLFYHCLR